MGREEGNPKILYCPSSPSIDFWSARWRLEAEVGVERRLGLEHANNGVKQLAHHGDQRDLLSRNPGLKPFIVGFHRRVMGCRDHRRQEQSTAKTRIASLAHLLPKTSIGVLATSPGAVRDRIKTGIRHELTNIQVTNNTQ